MDLISTSFAPGERIPERCAFGRPDPADRIAPAGNHSPHVAWQGIPAATRSIVVTFHDSDAPARPDEANREGRVIAADAPRVAFDHWVLVDIDPDLEELEEGAFSSGVTRGGKDGPAAPHGTRTGLNDFTTWFAKDPEMHGRYFGYDGPCPPWNDEKIHAYHLTAFALDTPRCAVDGIFTRADVLAAIAPHVLTRSTLTGFYSLNPDVGPS
jgi:hypothetical protein